MLKTRLNFFFRNTNFSDFLELSLKSTVQYNKHVKNRSKVSSNESSYLEELAYIDFSEETRSPWLPDNGKQAYKLTKLVEYVMRFG